MRIANAFWPATFLGIALMMLHACAPNDPAASLKSAPPAIPPAVLTIEGIEYRVSGPYVHENLAVYLFHSDTQDPREFITLDEGLKSGEVKVSEKAQEQVNALIIENGSAKHLFLHEGDRVRGGKQDRTVFSSLVLAPKSAPQELPSFCIEHSRWNEGDTGRNFQTTANTALSPKTVRSAAKVSKSQSQVWDSVAQEKAASTRTLGTPNTNSSLNETMDSPKIQMLSDACAKALSGIVEKPADAVGMAIAVNGKIEEVDVYPNHGVLLKISPRLLQSYAVQAAQEKNDAQQFETPESKAIVAFINEGKEKDVREEKINAGNSLKVRNYDNKKAQCATLNDGRIVHWQALSGVELKMPHAAEARQDQQQNVNRNNVNQRP